MSEGVVLKWSWQHHVLTVRRFDSLDEAVGAAFWEQEGGDGAPDAIEVVAADRSVRRIEGDELDTLLRKYEEAQIQTYPPNGPRPFVAKVVVRNTKGTEATLGWYRDMEQAEADLMELEALLGPRVTLALL